MVEMLITAVKINTFEFLLIGAICMFISIALDSVTSNGLELCIACVSKIGGYLFLLLSLCVIFFNVTNYAHSSFDAYKVACERSAVKMMGGRENIEYMRSTFDDLGISTPTDIRINTINKTADSAKTMVLELSEEELDIIYGIE